MRKFSYVCIGFHPFMHAVFGEDDCMFRCSQKQTPLRRLCWISFFVSHYSPPSFRMVIVAFLLFLCPLFHPLPTFLAPAPISEVEAVIFLALCLPLLLLHFPFSRPTFFSFPSFHSFFFVCSEAQTMELSKLLLSLSLWWWWWWWWPLSFSIFLQ